ncbi:MAG: cytochrome b/b6 domain-containing protein [Halothiobacillaceae bacterium]
MSDSTSSSNGTCLRVWDLPTRLFHWVLFAAVTTSFLSMYATNATSVHAWSGYTIMTLILFRLLWGFVGTQTARFTDFVPGPRRLIAYLRHGEGGQIRLGHNPLGALSVLALLASLTVQWATGLFADDDIFFSGPLASLVSSDTRRLLTAIHHNNANVLIGLIALHVSAIAFYALFKRQNLVGPMFTGRRCLKPDERPDRKDITFAPWWKFILGAAIAIAITAWVVNR